jgi:uncharacterized protein YgiM (DUF1202 family)
VNPTAVRAGPGVVYAPVESLSAKAPVDVVEVSKEGWAKVRLGSGKQGWVPVDAIDLGVRAAVPSDAGHD